MFYVYVHRRLDNNNIFYVGKGKRDRATSKQRNQYWKRIVAKHGYTIEIVSSNLEEEQAHSLEVELIAFYGRENLTNLTDGGEGRSGSKQKDSTKAKISNAMKGKKKSDETVAKMKAYQNLDEHKKFLSSLIKGRKASDATKKLLSNIAKRQHADPTKEAKRIASYRAVVSRKLICVELGLCFAAIADAERFLMEEFNIKKGANKNINTVLKGKRKYAYKFTWQYIGEKNGN